MSRRGWVLFAVMSVIWGIPYLFIKVAVGGLAPSVVVWGRLSIAVVVLLPLALATGQLRGLRAHWRWLLGYAAVEVGLPWWLLTDAERRIGSGLAGLLVASVPLFGALLARLAGTERISRQRLAGLLVGIVGVGALLGLDITQAGRDGWALVEVLVTSLGYATGPMIIQHRLARLPSIGVNAASLSAAALAYTPLALAQLPARWPSTRVLGSVAVLGLVCTAAAFLLFFKLIAEVGSARSTVITYVNPAVAVGLGVAVLGERLTLGMAVGFVLILAGSWVATRRDAGFTGTSQARETSFPDTRSRLFPQAADHANHADRADQADSRTAGSTRRE